MFSLKQNILSGEYTIRKCIVIVVGLFIQALGGFACGTQPPLSQFQGGTEAGNPPSAYRQIIGMVPPQSEWQAEAEFAGDGDCVGRQIWVQQGPQTVVIGSVDFECRFSFWVETGQYYHFSLSLSSEEQIPLLFTTEEGLSEQLHVEASERPLSWGQLGLALDDDRWVALPNTEAETDTSFTTLNKSSYGHLAGLMPMQAKEMREDDDAEEGAATDEKHEERKFESRRSHAVPLHELMERIAKDGAMMNTDGSVEEMPE